MTPEELQAIRERYEKAKRILTESGMYESMQDVPRLLDEVERLRGALELIANPTELGKWEAYSELHPDETLADWMRGIARQALYGGDSA